jgi:hypothetical protein
VCSVGVLREENNGKKKNKGYHNYSIYFNTLYSLISIFSLLSCPVPCFLCFDAR